MSFLNKSINIDEYPNALAHLKIYPQDQHIEFLDVDNEESAEKMAKKQTNRKSRKSKNSSNSSKNNKTLDLMWKFMSNGKIDISYACVGYSFDGRPVLDYTSFINLLMNYGFDINDSLMFIDDFVTYAEDDPKAPIIMTNVNTARIMSEIKPLVD